MMTEYLRTSKTVAAGVLALLISTGPSWAQPNTYQREGLTVQLPSSWAAQSVDNLEDQPLAVLRTPRGSIVIIRAYTSDGSSLDELQRQLCYGIVVKQEGRLIKIQNCKVLEKPARRVEYWARSTNGPMKNFVRYYLPVDGEVLTIHCVSNANFTADQQDFEELIPRLTYKVQDSPEPAPSLPKAP